MELLILERKSAPKYGRQKETKTMILSTIGKENSLVRDYNAKGESYTGAIFLLQPNFCLISSE